MASLTPRTDAATHDDWSGGASAVDVDVSKQLEIELGEALAVLNEASSLHATDCNRNAHGGPCKCWIAKRKAINRIALFPDEPYQGSLQEELDKQPKPQVE